MKNLLYTLLGFSIFFLSCEKHPDADFYVSNSSAEIGEAIFFKNTSYDAYEYEWDFGDGTWTNIHSPSHAYISSGTYIVTLTVWSNDGHKDVVSKSVIIKNPPPTVLEIEVLEYYNLYPVPDASVLLYTSLNDWYDQYNPYMEGLTNSNGIVSFVNIPAIEYFLDIWQFEHDNYLLADEDINNIRTGILYPNEINYLTAYVDFVPSKKKGGKSSLKIMKLERRKPIDKREPMEELKK